MSNLGERSFSALVIEEEAVLRGHFEEVLTHAGFEVYLAATCEEGACLAASLHPDVITLDVTMADMEGWSLLAQLKSDDDLSNIPVVIVSALDDRDIGVALGAAEYLLKPVEPAHLVEVLKRNARGVEGRERRKSQPTILIVEDDADMRELLRLILERESYHVVEAEDGVAALERVSEEVPSLILLDLMMPRVGGFEFISGLRATSAWHSIPVLVITARTLTREEKRQLDDSVTKVLQKGVYRRDQLMEAIRALLLHTVSAQLASGKVQ